VIGQEGDRRSARTENRAARIVDRMVAAKRE